MTVDISCKALFPTGFHAHMYNMLTDTSTLLNFWGNWRQALLWRCYGHSYSSPRDCIRAALFNEAKWWIVFLSRFGRRSLLLQRGKGRGQCSFCLWWWKRKSFVGDGHVPSNRTSPQACATVNSSGKKLDHFQNPRRYVHFRDRFH